MPIAPPPDDLGLWPRVNALVEWPDTDEDRMRTLAASWGEGAGHADTLGQFNLSDLLGWNDQAGEAFHGTMLGLFAAIRSVSTAMHDTRASVASFADTVTAAKQNIVDVIVTNLPAYAKTLALDPTVAAAAQERFVTDIATWIQGMLDSLAAQGPTPAPFVPPRLPKEPTVLDTVGDVAGVVSAVAGIAAMAPPLTLVAAPLSLLSGGVALGAHALDAMVNGSDESTASTLANDALGLVVGLNTVRKAQDFADFLRLSETPAPIINHAAAVVTDNPVIQARGAMALHSALTVGGQAPTVAGWTHPGDIEAVEANEDIAEAKMLLNAGKLLPNPALDTLRFLR